MEHLKWTAIAAIFLAIIVTASVQFGFELGAKTCNDWSRRAVVSALHSLASGLEEGRAKEVQAHLESAIRVSAETTDWSFLRALEGRLEEPPGQKERGR